MYNQLQFASIASGSSGNCLFAGSDDCRILIDAGISKKRIEEGLSGMDVDPGDIDALLITHEHSDHIKGLGVWSRKYKVPVYATKGTLLEVTRMQTLGKIDPALLHVIKPGVPFEVKGTRILPIPVSHDARDPVCYRIDHRGKSIGTVTDLGKYDEFILSSLQDCDLLYAEANHDERMLETGPYPYPLKLRIAGNYGHLSNELSGQMIDKLRCEKLQTVILGHLSKENNYPELALASVKAELERHRASGCAALSLSVAPRDTASEVFCI